MPTNVTPDYKKAEQAYRQAREPRERLDCLKELLGLCFPALTMRTRRINYWEVQLHTVLHLGRSKGGSIRLKAPFDVLRSSIYADLW